MLKLYISKSGGLFLNTLNLLSMTLKSNILVETFHLKLPARSCKTEFSFRITLGVKIFMIFDKVLSMPFLLLKKVMFSFLGRGRVGRRVHVSLPKK